MTWFQRLVATASLLYSEFCFFQLRGRKGVMSTLGLHGPFEMSLAWDGFGLAQLYSSFESNL